MDKPQARFGILEFAEGVLGIRLYLWQRKALLSIAAGYPTALVAANGAGKTSTVLVPGKSSEALQIAERLSSLAQEQDDVSAYPHLFAQPGIQWLYHDESLRPGHH